MAQTGSDLVLSDLELDLASRKGLILHDNSGAGGQDQKVQLVLDLVGLLVPVSEGFRVCRRDQGHLQQNQARIRPRKTRS